MSQNKKSSIYSTNLKILHYLIFDRNSALTLELLDAGGNNFNWPYLIGISNYELHCVMLSVFSQSRGIFLSLAPVIIMRSRTRSSFTFPYLRLNLERLPWQDEIGGWHSQWVAFRNSTNVLCFNFRYHQSYIWYSLSSSRHFKIQVKNSFCWSAPRTVSFSRVEEANKHVLSSILLLDRNEQKKSM